MSQADEQTDARESLAPSPAFAAARAQTYGQVALLVVLTVATYLPAMRGDLLWDDDAHVPRPHLQSLAGLARIWFEPSATQQYYPLTNSFYWLQFQLWGSETLGYHLVNVLLHAANACLVLALLRKLAVPGALLAAAIFAVHPVHVESVAWISEQKNTLSALFYLAAAWFYLDFDKSRNSTKYCVAYALFVLGLLSKSVIASLPAALLLVFWWQRGMLSWRRDWVPLLPYFAVGAVAGLATAWLERTQVGAEGEYFDLSFVERFLLASRVPWFYAWKLVWPADLMFFYPRWTIDASAAWQWLFPLATFTTLSILILVAWRWRLRGPLTGVLYFLGTLFPVLGFLNVYPFLFSYVADHFQYLPSLGLIALAAAGLTLAAGRLPASMNSAARTASVLLVAVLAWLSWQQSQMYSDVVTLYRTTLAKNPGAWLAHNNLGIELAEGLRIDEAIRHYQEAMRLKPDAAEVHYNYGNALLAQDKRKEATDAYREALQLLPEYPQALSNLASLLSEQGESDEAIALLEKAIKIAPQNPDAHDKLGAALVAAGRVVDAAPHLAKALELDPNHPKALSNMSNALLASGHPHEAIDVAVRSIKADPKYAPAHNNLGAALAQIGRYPEAVTHLREATRLDPEFVLAYGNLMAAYAAAGRYDDAATAARKGLEVARATGKDELAAQLEQNLKQLEAAAAAPGESNAGSNDAAPAE